MVGPLLQRLFQFEVQYDIGKMKYNDIGIMYNAKRIIIYIKCSLCVDYH